MKARRFWCFVAFLVVTGVPIQLSAEETRMARPMATAVARLPIEGKLPQLDKAGGWINSPPLRASDLRGKVVLVDFWTYTCINWRRTLPWLRAWARKYQDQGLVVIGVHTPEFSFEKHIDNVRRAAQEQAVGYPIAIDSDFAIWDAFNNHYWPALYFVDAQGRIRHHQFGEGDYEKLEAIIRQLLAEAGQKLPESEVVAVEGREAEAAADWKNLKTPETYVGYSRADGFSSPGGKAPNRSKVYQAPELLKLNQWALVGNWTLRQEFAISQANGRIAYRFHARDLHMVMGPATAGTPVRFRVSIDGKPPGDSHGVDVDAAGNGTIDQSRMYQLIRQTGPIADRLFEIEFLESQAQVFSFTFG